MSDHASTPRMSSKQAVYQEILRLTLPHIRNHCSRGWLFRIRDRGVSHDSELIHNIWPSLFEPDFQAHDLWFLNCHCRRYAEGPARTSSSLYPRIMPLIGELFTLVPDGLRSELRWRPESSLPSAPSAPPSTAGQSQAG